jgi:uncharacterized protein with PIN domain
MKFVVDCMLGKLAKWLKILGFDTVYFNKAEDKDLLLIARRQKRTLLTKDHRLLEAAKDIHALFIESEVWTEQLIQVLATYNLSETARPHSRCLACNVRLKTIPKRMARNLVTPFVLARASSFAVCPSCERVYWPGTHFRSMDMKIGAVLQKARARRHSGQKKKIGTQRAPKKG